MNRVCLESLLVVWFIFIMFSLAIVYADYQADALIAFKEKISDDPENVTALWELDGPEQTPCSWMHIGCEVDGQVTTIQLEKKGISGELVMQLGSLKFLWLSNNNITGQIPAEIGDLSNLRNLDLQNNRLTGLIPNSLGKLENLLYLNLNDNNLDGSIPTEIGDLSNLITLDLHNNSLTGPIPDTLSKLENLQTFALKYNNLTGPVPLALPSFKNLTEVSLGGNDLCGPLTARCIDSTDPKKCTDDYQCPCWCGPTFTTPCDLKTTPVCTTSLCCWN